MLDPLRLTAICERFGINPATLKWVSHSQNAVYEYLGPHDSAILRISYGRGRTQPQVEAELAWVRELAARGINVCLPRLSLNGQWCERVTVDAVEYLAVLFDHAPGRRIEQRDLDAAFYRSLGQLTAQLHTASFDDAPPEITLRERSRWYESRLITTDVERYGPPPSQNFQRAVTELIAGLRPLVESQLSIIHGDLSLSNIHRDGDQLWLFDFDNCEVGSVLQDFAVILYDSIYCRLLHRVLESQLIERCHEHWSAFLLGYRSLRPMQQIPAEPLRMFLMLREAAIYIHYLRSLDPSTMSTAFRAGMEKMREHVEQRVTPVPITVWA